VDEAARLTGHYLALRAPAGPLLATLCRSVLREDADFHTYQMLEAGIRQFHEWADASAGDDILIAVARFLAAHAPTERSQLQTAEVARKLHRGELLHESDPSPEASEPFQA
jgi:hypothetical protein